AVHGVRPKRAESPRGAAHAAAPALLGLDRAPLGRSRVPGGVSVVQHAALLAGPDPGAARADRADGRRAAQSVTASRLTTRRMPASDQASSSARLRCRSLVTAPSRITVWSRQFARMSDG